MATYEELLKEIRGEFRCSGCGTQITISSESGMCRSCVRQISNPKRMTKVCKCGVKLASWNMSGFCTDCLKKRQRKYYILTSADNKKKSTMKTGKRGKCRRCKKRFDLEAWQHSALHWCPECRASNDYQNYYSDQKIIERFSA